ncbi:MAG: HDOD domain-containing protein, partial [candidate division Zixibacteria bacterium]|nr:HDOD domain-containing protein [candidate division Zixibacteria bacterium]NIR67276.1 HDOD domain-containing protein [candidate division Zixibacteria bacterium]NIS16112.1 HDOD domain-containing protein [candidate division Zixibacteria bacterium]NIS48659.1 HDOD domain-containing protein [candidate division Zixibacteria bacterium]NIT53526.1 HDOD domain-containing protein [candidate division Zixibacteria bacterium]
AIMFLGSRNVRAIALSVSVVNVINRLDTRIDLRSYWKHSLEVAMISEAIASRIGLKEREETYIAGILHDIGILALDACFPREYERLWKDAQNGGALLELEESLFGTNHCRVGSYLVSKWNLPEIFAYSVSCHHDTFKAEKPDNGQIMAQIVSLAEMLAKHNLDLNYPNTSTELDNGKILMKNLGLDDDDISEIEAEIIPKLLDATNFLDIEVDSPVELLIEANSRLFDVYQEIQEMLEGFKKNANFKDHIEYDRLAVEILHTVVATFSHYFNNACASMLGRAQLIEIALKKGELKDNKDILHNSLVAIHNGVNSITGTISELKQVKSFKTTLYHDKTLIIDLEDSLKKYKPQKAKIKAQV